MNYKLIKNHIRTMDMMSEEINKGFQKYFEERNKTVEQKCQEARLSYTIKNDCIVLDNLTPLGNQREDYEYENQRDLENMSVIEKSYEPNC